MTNMKSETLGRRIARLRLQHAMTQERLANIANVSAQAVSKWENDQSYPDIMLLPLLAKTFGVTVDELLGVDVSVPVQSPAPVAETIHVPVVEVPTSVAETAVKAEPVLTPEPAAEPEPAPVPDPDPEPEPEEAFSPKSEAEPAAEIPPVDNECASRIRLHVVRMGRDAVNLSIPLAAARIVTNVVGYIPDRIIEGVDIVGLASAASKAGKGTLIDVDDGCDRVIISLE